jgi:hypothetical protein
LAAVVAVSKLAPGATTLPSTNGSPSVTAVPGPGRQRSRIKRFGQLKAEIIAWVIVRLIWRWTGRRADRRQI